MRYVIVENSGEFCWYINYFDGERYGWTIEADRAVLFSKEQAEANAATIKALIEKFYTVHPGLRPPGPVKIEVVNDPPPSRSAPRRARRNPVVR